MVRTLFLVCFTLVLSLMTGCADVVGPEAGGGTGGGGTGGNGAMGGIDICDTQVCECDIDADCNSREVCDSTTGPGRVCVCAPTYVNNGGGCVFGGALLAPELDDADPWTTTGNVVLDPFGVDGLNPGQATWDNTAICDRDSVLSQSVVMPPYDRAEPFALDIVHVGSSGFGNPSPVLGINGRWISLDLNFPVESSLVCLGDAAYGGEVEFRVVGDTFTCPSPDAFDELLVDRLEVVRASDVGLECPAPGVVLDGDFEGNGSAWEGLAPSDGFAGVQEGIGSDGSRAGRLQTATLCSEPTLDGLGSWPLPSTLESPALRFLWNGTSGRDLDVILDSTELILDSMQAISFTATGAAQTTTLCIAPAFLGLTTALRFGLPSTFGVCADPDVRDFVFDDLEVVSAPECGDDPYLVDGDFEGALDGSVSAGWSYVANEGEETVAVIGGDAQSGVAALELTIQQECGGPSARATAIVPEPDANGGPALKYFYRIESNPETETSSFPGNGVLPEGALDYAEETVCLDPEDAGRAILVSFSMSPGAGVCADTFPVERALFDNVRLTTDESCPSE